jgi:cell wall-associated NlpC family hydrolase
MALAVPTKTNSYTPTAVQAGRTGWSVASVSPYSKAYGDIPSGLGSVSQRVDDFLRNSGPSNPPFNTSTSGKLTPAQGGNKPITRGFIRRSAPDSGDPMSLGSLNFMYNPTDITRDYTSYLDQAALDPFNTIYDSGNLVTAPNFVNFSFTLFFDRQIEAASTAGNKGVLDDYKYFDMVVRNVPPIGASSGVPDNGIMMANPKDITVVFSKDLTVQGRPTNARVQFIKFDSNMTPTRMVVSLTMIITYFGPLRRALGFDTYQRTGDYEALVPYRQIYSDNYTVAELNAAQKRYQDGRAAVANEEVERISPYSNATQPTGVSAAGTAIDGVSSVAVGANGDLRAKTFASAVQRLSATPMRYSQASRYGPNSYDCSGLVFKCYQDHGAAGLLGNPAGAYTGSILASGDADGWRKMARVVYAPRGNGNAQFLAQAQRGDLLLRINSTGSAHIAFVDSPDAGSGRMNVVHASSSGMGAQSVSSRSLASYTHLLRPAGTGSSTPMAPVLV